MKLALYLPRYLQAISLPLLGPKILSFFDFLCSASPYCISILWHKIQSRSFSHAHTSNLPANRSRAINEVVFFHRQVVVLCQGYCGIIGWLVKDCVWVAARWDRWECLRRVCRFGNTRLAAHYNYFDKR